MKRAASFFLSLALLLGLTACGKEEAEEPDRYGGIRYIPVFRTLDADLGTIRSGCAADGCVYLTGSVITNEDYQDRETRLLRVPLDGGEIEALPVCTPSGGDRNVIVSTEGLAVAAGEDGTLWLLESVRRWNYDFPEDFDPYDMSSGTRGQYYISSEGNYVLSQLNGEGSELFRQEWPMRDLEARLGVEYINEAYISAGGDVTFWNRSGMEALVTMDKAGTLLGRLAREDPAQYWQGVGRLGDGRLAVWGSYLEGGLYKTNVNAVSRKGDAWEERWTLPGFSTVYNGDTNSLFYYNEGSELLAWREPASAEDRKAEENTPLLSWVNTGLESSGNRTVSEFLPDGRLVVVQGGDAWSSGEPAELVVLTPTDDPPEKTVLTLGTPQLLSDTEEAVRKFNRTNPDYCIEVREYMDYSAGEDWRDATARLAAEVGAGKLPDILDTYGMPLYRWAASGILEDLWPWIDLDRDIGREDLMVRVLEADSIDGKLYEISDGFFFFTVIGAKDAVGDRTAWTPEEMEQSLENMPDGCLAMPNDREWVLQSMLQAFWNRLVDWKVGTCSFDSEEFREILAFCGRFPAEGVSYDERAELFREGGLMLVSQYVSRFWDLQQIQTDYGADLSFVGYPNAWGAAGSSFGLNGGLAMTSAGKHKEGAWAFLRTRLLPEGQPANPFMRSFPLNKEAFEKMAQMSGNRKYAYSDSSGNTHFYRKPSKEEYDQVMALYEASDSVYRWDDSLGEIIMEIAGAYFAGDKSLDETVELIQNRAALYMSENT